ncbi:MAG: D-alanyl-D-alanine carboxypeptidase family protein [Breznakia sp.]
MFYISQTTPLIRIEKKLTYEYGETIDIVADLNISKKDSDRFQLLEIDTSTIVYEKDKKYPAVGTYKIQITYQIKKQKKHKTCMVTIKDTTKPLIKTAQQDIQVNAGDINHDFKQYFDIIELSDYDITINKKAIDFHKVGTYPLEISVSDVHKNKAKIDITVNIMEKKDTTTNINNPSTNKIKLTYVDDILIVNKKYPLPENYAPQENPTAKQNILRLISDMQASGYNIDSSYSGYRSYAYQASLYQNYVNTYGQEQADIFSVRPGYSEHQTGLVFDLKHTDETLLERQAEADWVSKNAHTYGFIVRYPKGKESVTGYQSEPWHLRYVGNIATNIYHSGLTLEEYLGFPGGGY